MTCSALFCAVSRYQGYGQSDGGFRGLVFFQLPELPDGDVCPPGAVLPDGGQAGANHLTHGNIIESANRKIAGHGNSVFPKKMNQVDGVTRRSESTP